MSVNIEINEKYLPTIIDLINGLDGKISILDENYLSQEDIERLKLISKKCDDGTLKCYTIDEASKILAQKGYEW